MADKIRKTVLSWMLILILQGAIFLGFSSHAHALTEDQKLFNDAWRTVNQAYVDETFNHQNWWLMREKTLKKPLKDREATYSAIQSMLGTLDDPFTRFLKPPQYRSLQTTTSGELSGVGLQVMTNAQTGQLEVLSPILGSPAAKAGLMPHDKILAIDGEDTLQISLDEAAERMRGAVGSIVNLRVEKATSKEVSEIDICRDLIALHAVAAEVRTLPKDLAMSSGPSKTTIAYLQLKQFNANAAQEMKQEIARMESEQVQGYILDLRNNPGGLLQAGVEIARLWLDPAIIVFTVDRHGILNSFSATDEARTHAPLVILVNNGSASASEILAGALQDNQRAALVGEQTFGKGSIQSLFDLPDGSGMAVTIAKYETPSHHNINKVGITPDVLIESQTLLPDQFGTDQDPQYQAALMKLLTPDPMMPDALTPKALNAQSFVPSP